MKPTRSGHKSYGDGGTAWFLFNKELSDDELDYFLDIYNVRAFYSGPGQPFARKPSIRRQRGRTLITQSYGQDI